MKRVNLEKDSTSKLNVENLANIFFKLFAISLIATTIYFWNSYFLNAQDKKEEKLPDISNNLTEVETDAEDNLEAQSLEEIQKELEMEIAENETPIPPEEEDLQENLEIEISDQANKSDEIWDPEIVNIDIKETNDSDNQKTSESILKKDMSDIPNIKPEQKTNEEAVENNFSNDQMQTLEEIQKELKIEKAKIESREPKIDIESLGLDLIEDEVSNDKEEITNSSQDIIENDKVDAEGQIEEEKNESPKPEIELPQKDSQKKDLPKEVTREEPKEDKADSTLEAGPLERIRMLLRGKNKKQEVQEEKMAIENDNPEPKNEVAIQENPKIDEKLENLRKQYLAEITDENTDMETQVPTPVKKHFSSYSKNQMAPLPIMSQYRTNDNLHIPIFPTAKRKIQNLFDAIKFGDVAAFNDAYKNVKNPNITNEYGDSVVSAAILLRQHAILASSLAQGSDPNKPNGLNYTPVELAIELLDFTSLNLLIKNGANIDYQDAFGRTYMMKAAKNGFLPAVEILTESGSDINAIDKDGFTALSIAHRHKNKLVESYLLRNGAKAWVKKPIRPEKYFLIQELQNRWQ